MNNEKQHSEYKIIETVATPTFDGVSVETHPEDQLGGTTPEKTRYIGWYEESGSSLYAVGQTKDKTLVLYGSSLTALNGFVNGAYRQQMGAASRTLDWFKNDATDVLGLQINNVEFNDIRTLKDDVNIEFSPHYIF